MVEVDKFNQIQNHIMRSFGEINRYAVYGGPGIGKTVLVQKELNHILSKD